MGGLYLLASVLDRFLALHATVNSFVRTSALVRGRSGKLAAWPAWAGARELLCDCSYERTGSGPDAVG